LTSNCLDQPPQDTVQEAGQPTTSSLATITDRT